MRQRLGRHLVVALSLACCPAYAQQHAAVEAHEKRTDDDRPAGITPSPGKPRTANNVLYAEFLGPGIAWSVNYERTFLRDFSARGGFSIVPTVDGAPVILPITLAYHGAGNGVHSLELAAGVDVAVLFSEGSYRGNHYNPGVDVAGLVSLGYRLQPLDGGFFLRAGLDVLFSQTVYPWPHLSMGATF